METLETTNLPALCDTAIRDLAEVKSIGECLKIRNVMEAARVYAAKHKMAQEAQDACTKIVVLAERRIGQELIAAQQRGELAKGDGTINRPAGDNTPLTPRPSTLTEVGIHPVQAQRYRQMAELEESDIEEVASGMPLSRAGSSRRSRPGSRAMRTFRKSPKANNPEAAGRHQP